MHSELRQELSDRLQRLQRRHDKLDAHLTNADREVPADWDDRAQMMENDEVMEGIDDVTRREIAQVKAALTRIEQGTYGQCLTCGETIPAARMKAVPTASQCVDCAS